MAISGSLNFLTASSVLAKDTSIGNVDGVPVDFVGMNTIIVDPLTLASNLAGYPDTRRLSLYTSSIFGGDMSETDTFNSLILNRNGPYQHAMWQQYRGGEHTIASKLRLNNTMSVDQSQPDPLSKHLESKFLQARKEAPNQPDGYFHYPGASSFDHKTWYKQLVPAAFPSLTNFYEPSVISKYKPFIYSVQIGSKDDDDKVALARASFMNQIKFFSNDQLNAIMKMTSGDIVSASAIDKNWTAQKHSFYKVLSKSKQLGAAGFIYSERLFPKSISAYRAFKLQKPGYEEKAGTSTNGYDRKNPRSFWREDQGGGTADATSGTTRLRTDGLVTNSAGITQKTQIRIGADYSTTAPISSTRLIIGGHINASPSASPLAYMQTASLAPMQFLENGIVVNQQNTLSSSNGVVAADNLNPDGMSSTTFAQLEAYQPYNISLLSMWPLDPRQDIFDKPAYLTSSIGGKGLQIGLTPHKAGNNFGSPGSLFNSAASTTTGLTAITSSILQLQTGSAGELVYSTKPTIFFYRTGSAGTDFDGYVSATASLQYHRHTFPYNTPFFATHKIRNRSPMYNSYSDFVVDDIKYFGRDYSIVPEFRMSDNFDYYYKYFFGAHAFDENAYLYRIIQTAKNHPDEKKHKKVVRDFAHPLASTLKHKLNFLKLDGANPTASSDLESLQGLIKTTTAYDYDHITGPQAVTLDKAKHTYARQSPAVSFYEKYSHADDLVSFSHLMDVANGFQFNKNTVPNGISFTCHGVKKLLPYNGFYPVTRTAQVGSYFVDFLSPHIGRRSFHPNNAQDNKLPGYLQTFIEPFFGPGLLYNSIKSGIAVEYPVYTNDPYYYAPYSFISSSHNLHTRSARGPLDNGQPHDPGHSYRFQLEASQSFTYGGFQMVGSSRCIPSILNSRPSNVLPFEALYDMNHLSTFKNAPLRLITDFVDLDRNTPYPNTSASVYTEAGYDVAVNSPGIVKGSTANSHPAAVLDTRPPNINSYEKVLYLSSINNFLCETIEFFISDRRDGTKLPVITSAILNQDDITLNSDVKYYMGVSLKMGLHQVMCEGPRDAGVGGGKGVDNDFAGDYNNAKMRGYIYGPPMEVVPHRPGLLTPTFDSSRETAFTEAQHARPVLNENGTLTFVTAAVALKDYETYFAANLQDPAYQAYTPPYFYGESAVILQYSNTAENSANMQKVFAGAQSNSIISQLYHTGSGTGRDLLSLCKTFPSPVSISSGSFTRMDVEASIDIFNDPVVLKDLDAPDGNQSHIWYMAPKWVCPVLDFSSSVSAVRLREDIYLRNKGGTEVLRYSTITNDYHDNTTGKGMWGGYGTDPYDVEAMQTVYDNMARDTNKIDDTSIVEKGIYLEIKGKPFANQSGYRDLTQRDLESEVDTSRAVDEEFSRRRIGKENPGHATGSLATLLGFEEVKVEIGKIAPSKEISEAVVLIPYFEEPIIIEMNTGQIGEDAANHIIQDGPEIFSTREIIPGKHFLPIHKSTLENALSVILGDRWHPEDTDLFAHGATDDVLNTDVGKMIDLLLGDNTTGRKGYQLPPEFDFIHNYSVKPFQMIVMPMNDVLSKQDLIDIYQGVMPDPSIELQKIKSNKIKIKPAASPTLPGLSWNTFIYNLGDPVNATAKLGLNNFLSPRACMGLTPGQTMPDLYLQLKNSGYFDPEADYQSIPAWLTSPKQFYKKLKFMVFKVKQHAEKDYATYRERQIAKAVKHKMQEDGRKLQLPANFEKVLKNKRFNEVYGSNWPYDYFSLIESIKIDIEIEVNE